MEIMIEKDEFISKLFAAFEENRMGEYLDDEKCEKFYLLTERLLTENEKYNLTAITETDKMILNHYVDSATLSGKIGEGASLIDIGCGAGFPSLPLAILRPDIRILAMDATAKRVAYVAGCAELLSLSNVETVSGRAEEMGNDKKYRERFDYATARAVANMRVLSELALPFVKVGGALIAMKGRNAQDELAQAKKAISLLGGGDARIEEITLTSPSESLTHPIISVKKKSNTPSLYPRRFSIISKNPL